MTHYDELQYRFDGVSFVVFMDVLGDLAKYNPEKNTTTYLKGLLDLDSSDFDQYESDVVQYIEKVIIPRKNNIDITH